MDLVSVFIAFMYDSTMTQEDGAKNPQGGYVDLSDYGRGVAVWLARFLVNTPVRAWHVTIVHFCVMLVAAVLVSRQTLESYGAAALLLMIKNILDAVDGSLARLQDRPSRVGRFLDSNLDFVGNLVFFLSIPGIGFMTALTGFISLTFQGSVFNYYAVSYRTSRGGDTTSHVLEDATSPYPYDSPVVLNILYHMYRWLYGWQDFLVRKLDRMLADDGKLPSGRLMELFSMLGPGFQYLFIVLLLLLGIPQLIPDFFTYIFNVLMVCMLLIRADCSDQEHRID